MIGLMDLVGVAKSRLVAMAMAGQLSAEVLWVALKGAGTYFAAVASGDVAEDRVKGARAATCKACGECEWERTGKEGVVAGYCGDLADNGKGKEGPTCGCLVAMTVHGELLGAGKSVVGAERCPQGKWVE